MRYFFQMLLIVFFPVFETLWHFIQCLLSMLHHCAWLMFILNAITNISIVNYLFLFGNFSGHTIFRISSQIWLIFRSYGKFLKNSLDFRLNFFEYKWCRNFPRIREMPEFSMNAENTWIFHEYEKLKWFPNHHNEKKI